MVRISSRDELRAVLGPEVSRIKRRHMVIIALLSAVPPIMLSKGHCWQAC